MGYKLIGLMGPGEKAKQEDMDLAREVGELVAKEGYVLLTGGRNCGTMDAAMEGAAKAGGITIGILPGPSEEEASEFSVINIKTGMGQARNVINVLSSDLLVFLGLGPGTSSEFSLAVKHKKLIILGPGTEKLWDLALEFDPPPVMFQSHDPLEIIEIIRRKVG